ncbi:unnamed protein product [Triticum turgidum subsp. durum]|uniref:Disease resistance N-terminal domain-containing protein n=1 Tax=Triticum turgidum subsp. durum TaxID=4567 RepID=A0A9R1BMY6_TRITD|nr:unnamed protein product [Triticum turgidum subsp. durum]
MVGSAQIAKSLRNRKRRGLPSSQGSNQNWVPDPLSTEKRVISITRAVLNRAIHFAESAIAKEAALHLGIQRDQTFIADELEMMQGFLMAAHDDRDSHNRVVKIWVKQVRDVAYDVEDCLQDFAVRVTVRRSWWRSPRKLLHRWHVAKKMKELRARVEDVSQRNLRYHLIKASKPISADEQSLAVASATMSDIDEVRRQHEKAKVGLIWLISKKDNDLRVIAVSETNAIGLGETSIVKRAYEDLKIHKKFECFAWISANGDYSTNSAYLATFHGSIHC